MKKYIFESALQKTARTLTDKYSVNIVFEGDEVGVQQKGPRTDGVTITLPAGSDYLSKEDQNLITGYLDHEMSHVMFTDYDSLKSKMDSIPEKKEKELTHYFWNSVEDVMIEGKMLKTYKGVRDNFAFYRKYLLDMYDTHKDEIDKDANAKAQRTMALTNLYAQNGFVFNHPVYDNISPEEKAEIQYYSKYLYRAVDKTTTECLEIGKEYMEDFMSTHKDFQPPPQDALGQAINKKVKGKPEPANEEGDEEDKQNGGEYERVKGDDTKYVIASTKNDRIIKVESRDPVMFKQLQEQSAASVNVTRRKLLKAIQSTKSTLWEPGKSSGAINSRSLVDAYLGTSKNVFKKKVLKKEVNTVFEIMIDHSGSMGSCMHLAVQTAAALGELLNLLGVPFAVRGFTTNSGGATDISGDYARRGALTIYEYKQYDELWKSASAKLPTALNVSGENTYDGESLKFSVVRLLDRPETRKVLFWLNDGYPEPAHCDNKPRMVSYYKKVIKEAEKRVEVVAIGINSKAVGEYFKNFVVVTDISKLAEQCLNQLSNILYKNQIVK